VSVIKPNETALQWKTTKREAAVHLYLSSADGDAAELAATKVAGFPVTLDVLPTTEWINPEGLAGAVAAIIQVDADSAASLKRFQKLVKSVDTPLIATSFEPPLPLVRTLLHTGAADVIPLPLNKDEVEAAIAGLSETTTDHVEIAPPVHGKLVSFMKSVGGVGTTALLTQLAIRFAESEAKCGREACVIDLDVQFGDAAFQLGLQPKFSLVDLLEAGTRLDGHLLRATTIQHDSGINVIAAPVHMMPLEGVAGDHLLEIVDTATREFETVFIDLPTNWTNWSLSLIARSELVILVTELTVAGLNRARRQLDLLKSQHLDVEVRIVVNRFDKTMARTVSLADAKRVLNHDIAYTVSNDFPLMRAAIDRGIPIHEIKRKSPLARDLDLLDAGIAAALDLGR
jgi:pilus assembly protein CpaE